MISGQTTDGKIVFSNIFQFISTTGLPLEILIDHFKKRDLQIDWLDYYCKAIESGARPSGIKNGMLFAIQEVYGLEYRKEFEKKFKLMIESS